MTSIETTLRIDTLSEKQLVGKRLPMSLVKNRTFELWRSFMPRRSEIAHQLSSDVISIQVYSATHFSDFDPANEFEKWACVEVENFGGVPEGMETFVSPGGLYGVFKCKGLSTDASIFQYIFGTWLPRSNYLLDNRPHFEILGHKYKNNDPYSEEEIWIPIKERTQDGVQNIYFDLMSKLKSLNFLLPWLSASSLAT